MKQYEHMDNQKDQSQPNKESVDQTKQISRSFFSKYLPFIVIAVIAAIIASGGTYPALKQSNTPAQKISQATPPSPTPTPDPTSDWKTYTNSQNNFTFKYPSDWDVAQLDSKAIPSLIVAPKVNVDALRKVNFQVGGGKNSVMTILGPFSNNSNPFIYASDATKSVTSRSVIIAGLNATEYTSIYNVDLPGVQPGDVVINSIVENDGKKYNMGLVDIRYKDIYYQILSTFKFTN